MAEFVKFPATVEIATYTVGELPGTETAAITLNDDDNTAEVVRVPANTQATLFIDFTKGSLTNCIIKFYGSPLKNATTWYTETDESASSGTLTLNALNITLTASTTAMWHFPIGAVRSYKITVTGTGTATGSALSLKLGLRNN